MVVKRSKFRYLASLLLVVFIAAESFPVLVSAVTLNLQVAASADDGTCPNVTSDSGRSVSACGTGVINASVLAAGSHGGNDEWPVGTRFLNVTIPNAATITSATFTLKAQATWASPGTISYLVSAQAADDPTTFTTAVNQLTTGTRPRTTAVSAAWVLSSVTAETDYSIDITSVIQEIVNRAGWASGNDMVIIIDTGVPTTAGEWQDFYSYDNTPSKAPKLDIVYTAGGSSSPGYIIKIRGRVNIRGVVKFR